jgi:hypothetical protein
MPGKRWSSSELMVELRRFEEELRAASLSDHTVSTYVGRSEAFIRWLAGAFTPRDVGKTIEDGDKAAPRSLGRTILDDLQANLSQGEITRYLADYAAVTSYDAAFEQLRHATGNRVDLQREDHRIAVIHWLRAWGCRHLRRADTQRTADALKLWWETWHEQLPGQPALLSALGEPELLFIEQAYDALRMAPAAGRTLKGREIDVIFGDTAAAKTMFAARPQAFLPWDDPIRLAFGWPGGGAAYVELLRLSAAALNGMSHRLAVPVGDLPKILHRPRSSSPKLIDEFLWVRITKGL